jgi:hypothetical protein
MSNIHPFEKYEELLRRHARAVALSDASFGRAGDDYLTPKQREKLEKEIESLTVELEYLGNVLRKQAHDEAPAADHVDHPKEFIDINSTWSEQSVYAKLLGLRGELSIEEAEEVIHTVERTPHLYLTNGEACRAFESLVNRVRGPIE